MKKLALLVALLVAPVVGRPAPDLIPSHVQSIVLAATIAPMTIEPLLWQATTTTFTNAKRTAILTSDSGTESAPTAATVGLDLANVGAVSVILKTSSNATAGGTLQAYVFNPETATWARLPDKDLTAIASTNQSWDAIYVPVARGRVYWNPVGIGSVTTTIYIVGQVR